MKFILLIFILLFSLKITAQEDSSKYTDLGIETALSIGYTGFNIFLGPVYSCSNSQFYIGPKIALNSFYLPGHSHIGLNAGYRIYYLRSSSFSSFFSLDYQLSYFKLYDPYNHLDDSKKNNIQELVVGIGSRYSIHPRLHANITFGIGAYREKFQTIEDDKANDDFYGYTINSRLSLQYNLFKR